ncbi:MAG: insulinase family protein [Flavobacteriales bacterium]
MRTRILLISLSIAVAIAPACAQKTYPYTSIPGDPLATRIYTLDNGLTVYLSNNPDAPRIQTNIAVRAGSKNDPSSATGLAHYLEHMLFKGTSTIATVDWAKEAPLLQRISDLYELRRVTTDEARREAIYHQIDSVSHLAATYAVPNEYDKMVTSIGAKGTNAYTSTECTVYVNDIPSNEMEKWMMLESVRFQECVLRLFHTELETVFEEFNRGQDNDGRNASQAMSKALYKYHPYGTQTTIGTGEHLKNPSMMKIHEYFDTYYVPNNMAVIMAGDLDYDKTIAMVDKYFGPWKPKPVPPFTFKPEEPITAPVTMDVFGPQAEWVDLGWRFNGYKSGDPIMIELISGLLSNGSAGLCDLDLVQQQKVLSAAAYSDTQIDYSEFGMSGEAKEGQKLEDVRDLLLAELEKVKKGQFDDWLIEAVVNNYKKDQIQYWNDNNGRRAAALTDAFVLHKDWKDVVDHYDRMGRITKQEVMDFAAKNFSNNYVCVFKRTGENKDAFHVPKPKITPLDINRGGQSAFFKAWSAVPDPPMTPVFVDYKASIDQRTLAKNGLSFSEVPNTTNELFSLYYILDMGTNNDRKLDLAVRYLPYLGTATMSATDLKKEFFKLGLSYDVFAGEDRVYVTLSGLEKNLDKGIRLFEQVLAEAKADPKALSELVKDIGKERSDNLKNKGHILFNGLSSYARYGEHSPLRDQLSMEELKAVKPEELVGRIHELTSYDHRLFFYGHRTPDDMVALLDKEHRVPATLLLTPKATVYTEQPTTKNEVLYVDYDMVQTEMLLTSKSEAFDRTVLPAAQVFNEYFGAGLSSIVFQEIREAKALAYSAYAAYTTPGKKEDAHYVRGYVGTQTDKLGNAVTAMLALMNDMPLDERQFQGAKDAALKRIGSERITKENLFWNWDRAKRLGLDYDVRKDNYFRIQQMTLPDLKAFFDKEIKGHHYTYLVIGKEAQMDKAALEHLGPVRKLTLKDLFGYDDKE